MSIKLQIRRGTAANWAGANPTLLAGEIGFETDTGNLKVGDGTNVWSDLAYQFPYLTGARNHAPEDVTTLVIDQTNDRVGIGTNTPLSKVHIEDASPIIRLKDTGAAAYSVIDADNTTGSVTIGADAGNGVASSTLNLAVDGSTKATIDSAGSFGLGTTAPAQQLHIKSSAPVIRLEDTDGANTSVYAELSANIGGAGAAHGSWLLRADPNNLNAGSFIRMQVDGTNVTDFTSTGQAITGTLSVSGVLTPTGGVASSTIAPSAIGSVTGPTMIGRVTGSGAAAALTQAEVRQVKNNYAPLIGGTNRSPGDTAAVAGDHMTHTTAIGSGYVLPGTSTTSWFVINLVRDNAGSFATESLSSNSGIYVGGTSFSGIASKQYKAIAWCIGTV